MLSTLHTLPGYPVNGETRSSSAKKAKGPVRPASLTSLYFSVVSFFFYYLCNFFDYTFSQEREREKKNIKTFFNIKNVSDFLSISEM